MGLGLGNANANNWVKIPPGSSPSFDCPTDYSIEFDGLTENGFTGALNQVPVLGLNGEENFTITFWVKAFDVTGGGVNQRILAVAGTGAVIWNVMFRADGRLQFSGAWSDICNFAFVSGTWYHVAYSVDRGGSASWIIDGSLSDSKNVSGETDIFKPDGTLYLASNSSGNQLFGGNLTEIAIWYSDLSAAKLTELYDNTLGKCYDRDFSFSSDLKYYWPCFNTLGTFSNPIPDTVGGSDIKLNNMDATNVSSDSPL